MWGSIFDNQAECGWIFRNFPRHEEQILNMTSMNSQKVMIETPVKRPKYPPNWAKRSDNCIFGFCVTRVSIRYLQSDNFWAGAGAGPFLDSLVNSLVTIHLINKCFIFLCNHLIILFRYSNCNIFFFTLQRKFIPGVIYFPCCLQYDGSKDDLAWRIDFKYFNLLDVWKKLRSMLIIG